MDSNASSQNYYKTQCHMPTILKSTLLPSNMMMSSTYPSLPSKVLSMSGMFTKNEFSSTIFGNSAYTCSNPIKSEEPYAHPACFSKSQQIMYTNENVQLEQGKIYFPDSSEQHAIFNSLSIDNFSNGTENPSVFSVTSSLVSIQSNSYINHMTPKSNPECISTEYGNGALLCSNNSYNKLPTAPSSEVTGATTLIDEEYIDWNRNNINTQSVSKINPLKNSLGKRFNSQITSHTSRHGLNRRSIRFNYTLTTGTLITVGLSIISFFSPAAMVTFPAMKLIDWPHLKCNVDCETQLISLVIKLILIGAAAYLTFFRNHLYFICKNKSMSYSNSEPTMSSNDLNHQNIPPESEIRFRNNGRFSHSKLPRPTFLKSFLLCLIFIIIAVFWLFYGIRIINSTGQREYSSSVLLANRMTDCLLLVHFLGFVIIVLRKMSEETLGIKVLRCPDGKAKIYRFQKTTIQLAAMKILKNYVVDFQVHDPFSKAARRRHGSKRCQSRRISSQTDGIESVPSGNGTQNSESLSGGVGGLATYKFYDVDGLISVSNTNLISNQSFNSSSTKCSSHIRRKNAYIKSTGNKSQQSCSLPKGSPDKSTNQNTRKIINATNSNNDRYYEEIEYEKRVSKRRVRLMLASEDAFKKLCRCDQNNLNNSNSKPLGAYEAAQAIFSTLVKPLQKFLRTTRQQPRFSIEWVISHLTNCLHYDLGYRAFLEPFFSQGPILEDPEFQQQLCIDEDMITSWILYSDQVVSKSIRDGTVFHLCKGDISLFCTVRSLPNFYLREESFPKKCNKFIFKLDSETSV